MVFASPGSQITIDGSATAQIDGPSNRIARCCSTFGIGLALCGVAGGGEWRAQTSSDTPLNVLFILVDDLGWTDLACFGSDYYQTPAIDELARQSLRFTQAYAAAPVCSPTRAAILTGQFPARLDMTIWHEGAVSGGPQDRALRDAEAVANLPHAAVTLAERFGAAGYATVHVGKWHLGTAAFYPETQGYDVNVGGTFWGAPSTFFHPFRGPWSQQDPQLRYVPGLALTRPGDYLPDCLTDTAVQLLRQLRQRPFFMSLWFYTVHSPIEAPDDLVEDFRRKPAGRHHREASYAAMVRRMDHNVGRVLSALEELGLRDRTVVIFTSDNGGVDIPVRGVTPTSNAPLRSGKGTLYEGGLRVPLIVRWPNQTPAGGQCDEPVSSQDFFPTLTEGLGLARPADRELDGTSFLPLLREPQSDLNREALYWHFPHYYPRMTPGSAVRSGVWKLIHYYEDDRVELYNLAQDLAESTNLASTSPGIRATLQRQLNEWRHEVGANPPRQHDDR